MRLTIFNCLDNYGEEVEAKISESAYGETGILPSEMLLFCCLAKHMSESGLVVESGRKYGYSTRVLARNDFHVVSCETEPQELADSYLEAWCTNVELVKIDGAKFIAPFLEDDRRRGAAVLLDGPKGQRAYDLACEIQHYTCFTAIHDISKQRMSPVGAEPNPIRETLNKLRVPCFLSDDPEWVERTKHLDEEAITSQGYSSWEEMTQYGYTLGIFPGEYWVA